MSGHGLFTREDLKAGAATKQAALKPNDIPAERLWQLGLGGVEGMNPAAKTKHMPPSGAKHPLVYICGESPGEIEDLQGTQFVGKAGKTMRGAIPKGMEEKTRFDNVCRTRPPNNRTPEYAEIEGYRTAVRASIEEAKPRAILAVGMVPIRWALGQVTASAKALRGRRFPIQIGNHSCWLYVTYHPSYINRIRDGRDEDGVPGTELEIVFRRDVARCYAEAPMLNPPVITNDADEVLGRSNFYWRGDPAEVIALLEEMGKRTASVGIDIETNALRPYGTGAKCLSVAVAGISSGFAFAIDHPAACWSANARKGLLGAFQAFLAAPVPKVAHNLSFELEWFAYLFGLNVLRPGPWHDSMAAGYVLDERRGGLSLDFLCLQEFGIHLKAFNNLDRSNLAKAPVEDVLKYNLLDAAYCARLYRAQRSRLKAEGLIEVYKEQVRRVPSFVAAQVKGFPVDSGRVAFFQAKLEGESETIRKKIAANGGIRQYESRFGKFNPSSPAQVLTLFRDVLRCREMGSSTRESVLETVKHPAAKLVLQLRKLEKLRGTYVDPLAPATKDTVVWPDGKIHCVFHTTTSAEKGTASRRSSATSPNVQNYPIRKHAEIRSCFAPGPGYVVLKNDYGQLEARVIAMLSKDKRLVSALWEGFDIHAAWAEKINKAWPQTCQKRYGGFDKAAMKAFRGDVKSAWVFASFYGASWRTTAERFGMDAKVCRKLFDEFWDEFSGVRRWQNDLKVFYAKNGYVETPTGFRRHAPLNENMQINSPVQGGGSDIVVDAMNRLSERAQREDDWNLSPVFNIHDDAVLIVPKKKLDYYLEIVVHELLSCSFDFVNVPLVVESAAGPNWHEVEGLGTFASNDPGRAGKV